MLLSKNPIHSVFFLIIVFLHVSFFLLLLHVEFLAFLIFIVYLGAIAVLFLFVIMMFNIHILETRDNIIRYIPVSYTHLRAHETVLDLVCRLLLEKKNKYTNIYNSTNIIYHDTKYITVQYHYCINCI